jgi:hypothetical protein
MYLVKIKYHEYTSMQRRGARTDFIQDEEHPLRRTGGGGQLLQVLTPERERVARVEHLDNHVRLV